MSLAGRVAAAATRRDRRAWAVPAVAVAASTLVILAPLLRPGYVLAYDMVFAPQMPVDRDSLGLGSPLPRAVPSDLVVALASHVLPGDAVQKLVLVAILAAAGLGAARLAEPRALPRTAAALAYLWTPYLAERMLLGQWAVLIGYAGLPWLAAAAHTVAHAERPDLVRAWSRCILVLALMCLGGAPAWLMALLVLPVVLGWGARADPGRAAVRVLVGLGALAVFALPWLVPSVLRPGGVGADPLGSQAFAPYADTPFGVVVSVLTGGGIWNAETVPPGRADVIPAAGALVLLAVGLVGIALGRRRPVRGPLGVAAAVGLGVALVTCWAPAARALGHLPFGAVIRDSQRLVAPWVLLLALGTGSFCDHVVRRVRRDLRLAVTLLALLPVAVLPSLAWGISGRLDVVQYPSDFARVRSVVDADPRPGAVLVLPFDAYRRFAWNHGRTSMDPLERWLDRTVIISSDLPVATDGHTVVVRGEDRLASQLADIVRSAQAAGEPIARAAGARGVRWVVVDAHVDPVLVAGLTPHYRGPDLSLYEIPDRWVERAGDPVRAVTAPTAPVVTADVLVALVVLAAAVAAGLSAGARSPERL